MQLDEEPLLSGLPGVMDALDSARMGMRVEGRIHAPQVNVALLAERAACRWW